MVCLKIPIILVLQYQESILGIVGKEKFGAIDFNVSKTYTKNS